MSTITEPACYVLIRKDNTLLFVLRENTGFMDGCYSLPAGRVEHGETYAQGAAREALEEVGLTVALADLRHVFTGHRWDGSQEPPTRVDVYFEALKWTGTPSNLEPEKHSNIAWLPVDNLPENIMSYQRSALLKIFAGETYEEHGWDIEKARQKL